MVLCHFEEHRFVASMLSVLFIVTHQLGTYVPKPHGSKVIFSLGSRLLQSTVTRQTIVDIIFIINMNILIKNVLFKVFCTLTDMQIT